MKRRTDMRIFTEVLKFLRATPERWKDAQSQKSGSAR
jgi:hypothetical protein